MSDNSFADAQTSLELVESLDVEIHGKNMAEISEAGRCFIMFASACAQGEDSMFQNMKQSFIANMWYDHDTCSKEALVGIDWPTFPCVMVMGQLVALGYIEDIEFHRDEYSMDNDPCETKGVRFTLTQLGFDVGQYYLDLAQV